MRICNVAGSFFVFLIFTLCVSYSALAGNSLTVPSKKYRSIPRALAAAKRGDTVWVKEGTYKGPLKISPGITVISLTLHKAILNGKGARHVVTMGNKSTLSGFEIKDGHIGVYSEGVDNTISKCYIHNNQLNGISCVGHLPMIIDNIIFKNGGSGIQGWDVRSTIATINHNTIAHNKTHGISIGGTSNIIVENNIISHNERLGYKVDPEVKIKLLRNNFFLNVELMPLLPSDNFSFDPAFLDATAGNYMLSKDSKCRRMGSDNKDLGVRIVY